MQLTMIKLWAILSCFLIAGVVQVTANAQDVPLTEYRNVTFNELSRPKKVDLNIEQEKLVDDFVLKQHGKFFNYENYGAYAVNDRFVYVKLYLMLKDEVVSEWRKLQRQKALRGQKRQQSLFYDFVVIDTQKAKAFSLGITYKPEDGALRFSYLSYLNEQFVFEKDINQDGVNELFFIRGYESGFDFFNTAFNQYKLYLLADYNSLLFQEWVKNIDHGSIPQDISLSERKKPNITGLAGTELDLFYTIKYDDYEDLIKDDKSGLKRYNSQFYFNYIDKDERGISKQLILVWSKIYRASAKSNESEFGLTEEHFKWYEGDVTKKTAFVEKPVTEEAFKEFLANYNLSFDDGLTGKRLCDVK